MTIPKRVISELELHHNNGERMHFPSQDLTTELPSAPHKEDVFTRPCVKVVGKLKENMNLSTSGSAMTRKI